jgi:hypothetical protein
MQRPTRTYCTPHITSKILQTTLSAPASVPPAPTNNYPEQQIFTRLYQSLQGTSNVPPGFTKSHKPAQNPTRAYRIAPAATKPYKREQSTHQEQKNHQKSTCHYRRVNRKTGHKNPHKGRFCFN